MLSNLGDERVKDFLLVVSVLVVLFSGFYMMKQIDDLIEVIRKANAKEEQENCHDPVDEKTDDVV